MTGLCVHYKIQQLSQFDLFFFQKYVTLNLELHECLASSPSFIHGQLSRWGQQKEAKKEAKRFPVSTWLESLNKIQAPSAYIRVI